MAKEAKPAENNEATPKAYSGREPVEREPVERSWDDQRKEDERKDRERLRKEHEERTPEKLSQLRTELSKLKLKFEADVTKLRDEFSKAKSELEMQMGGYSDAPVVPSGPQPSNETLADGSPRRSITIPVTA